MDLQPGMKPVMNLSNKVTNKYTLLASLLFMLFVFSGCANANNSFIEKEVNPQINVFEVQLLMDEQKVHETVGSKGEKAMCVYGYEYTYADKNINIGFNSETQQVRRVTTRNPDTAIYGIKPGVELAQAYEIMADKGFTKDAASKYRFQKENIIFSIISMKGTHADGLNIEINPDKETK